MGIDGSRLFIEVLTAEAFAPFGEVIQAVDTAVHYTINGGTTERFHDLARLDPGDGGRIIASIFRSAPCELPASIRMMERHPRGSQAFMPLFAGNGPRPYLVVVAPPGPVPTALDLRCFIAQARQGVNLAAGVWHHPLLALRQTSNFLVLDREGPGDNCDAVAIAPPAVITAEAVAASEWL
ncbi:MAG: ureidoglycolate lyase [Burkholderiaceae bacterium]|nr:ureidoglycolate lyase [Burkholderiaceae bacterium]